MTDGRIPGKWINEPRFAEMNVSTWCILTKAITWCNEAGTDGMIKRRYLGIFHPDGLVPSAYAELVEMGIWEIVDGGYQFVKWNVKAHHGGLGQETAANVQAQKDRNKRKQQAYRDRNKPGVTGYVTGSVTGDVGQDRTGHDTLYTQGGSEVNATWETAVPGRPDLKAVNQ